MNNITRTRLDDLVKSYEDNQIQMEALEKANEKVRKDILKELSILAPIISMLLFKTKI